MPLTRPLQHTTSAHSAKITARVLAANQPDLVELPGGLVAVYVRRAPSQLRSPRLPSPALADRSSAGLTGEQATRERTRRGAERARRRNRDVPGGAA
jgi:hypothetical protein